MHSSRDPEARAGETHPAPEPFHSDNILYYLFGGRRGVLIVLLAALLVGAILPIFLQGAPADSLPSPVATSAAVVSVAVNSAGDAGPAPVSAAPSPAAVAGARGTGSTSTGQIEAKPSTPQPTSPPVYAIRPLAIPAMPPVVDRGPAPTRKPGTPDPDPTTQHVVVVDSDSGATLFQRNAFEPVAPASLTKIMTAILGIEYGRLEEHVKVDVDARTLPDSTVMGLEPWFDVTMEDLLYGLMLPSGNDAALAIGRYVAGSDERFAMLMNQKAKQLGLRCSHFVTPHGLDTSDHYSCPADMVTMARYGMQYPIFREIVKARSYDISESNIAYTLYNLNPLLSAFPGADGVKTGLTDSAGRALVGTAVRDGHRVYVAFMRSESGVAADGSLLLQWAFDSFTWPPPAAG